MALESKTLDDIFFRLAEGEIEAGQATLLQLCKNKTDRTDLDTLIFAALEFSRYPRELPTVEMFVELLQTIGKRRSAMDWRLVFLADVRHWTDLGENVKITELTKSSPREESQGPHEEAVLLLFEVTVTFARVLMLSAHAGSTINHFPATHLIKGCAALQLRNSERALKEFSDGASNPQKMVQQIRESLGDKYSSDYFSDGGAAMLGDACLTGQGLALRDLGRFAEALQVWKKLKTPPRFLIAEAERLKQRPVPSAAWRAKLAHGDAPSTKKAQTTETPKSGSKCFIATAACGSANAPDVQALRDFRDGKLVHFRLGRSFIKIYERFSPALARLIEPSRSIRWIVRTFLVAPLARIVSGKHSRGGR